MAETKSITIDPFIWNETYPEPSALFSFDHKSINAIINTADIVLDTNVLLLLLNTGSRSIAEVEKIYKKLIEENRLFIPAQVAREFAKNKSEKIKNLYNQFAQKKQNNIKISYCPLFEGLDEYKQLEDQERVLLTGIQEYSNSVSRLLNVIKNWGSNDPVSIMYRKIGLAERLIDSKLNNQKLSEDRAKRYAHKLPPGYKDSNKDDEGIGDFVIWSEILALGKMNKKDLIFVTGEEKPDWWTKSAGSELHVRYELVDEYRRSSEGGSFHLVNFPQLLELLKAEHETIDQAKVAQKEENESLAQEEMTELNDSSIYNLDFPTFARIAEVAVFSWVKKQLAPQNVSVHANTANVDVLATNDLGCQIAFEVVGIRHVEHIERRIKELVKAGKRFLSNKIAVDSAFRMVFVAESLSAAISATEFGKIVRNESEQFGFIIGYLNAEYEFIEVFRSYDSFMDEIVFIGFV